MSVELYTCNRCGATLGITGPGSGTEDDYAAEEHFDSEVEYHESGKCAPAVVVPIEAFSSPVDITADGRFTTAPPVVKADPRAEYVAGLRALADLLEANPALPLPHHGASPDYSRLAVFARNKDDLLAWARAIPGRKDKNVTDSESYGFELLGNLRGLHLLIYGQRAEVCTRVVTGTREVVKTVHAPDAPMVEVTEVVEDVEWVCEPLLAEATR
jgi:hypothetical protein